MIVAVNILLISFGCIAAFNAVETMTDIHPKRGTPEFDQHVSHCDPCYFAEHERAKRLTKMNLRAKREGLR